MLPPLQLGPPFELGLSPSPAVLKYFAPSLIPILSLTPFTIYSALRPLQSTRKRLPLDFQPNLFLSKPHGLSRLCHPTSHLYETGSDQSRQYPPSSSLLFGFKFTTALLVLCLILAHFLLDRVIAHCHLVYCTVAVSKLSTIEDAAQSTAVASLVWSSSCLASYCFRVYSTIHRPGAVPSIGSNLQSIPIRPLWTSDSVQPEIIYI